MAKTKSKKKKTLSAMYCEHANEMPVSCPCPPECWCRVKGACKKRFAALERKKEKAIADQNFELAAKYRDQAEVTCKGVRPAKGILVITVPVGNVPPQKIKDVVDLAIKEIRSSFERIKAANWLIFTIPSRSLGSVSIEQILL